MVFQKVVSNFAREAASLARIFFCIYLYVGYCPLREKRKRRGKGKKKNEGSPPFSFSPQS
jgi:hypothetical protein